ncbi:MAG: EpsI family protein, partial [Syntrophobacterales bacterium]
RQGNIIEIGYTQMEVVAACSGLRYIMPLLSLGCIFCYFYQRRIWKVAVLLAAMVPTAIIANAVRVAGMGIFPELQAGFWHSFSGWLIFIISFGFLFLLNRILNIIDAPQPQAQPILPLKVHEREPTLEPRPPLTRYLTAALVLVLIGIGVIRYSLVITPMPLRQSFNLFPLQLGSWQGKNLPVDPEMIKATWSDAHLNMVYRNSEGQQVSLWIAYYKKDEQGGAFKHTPRYCMTGSGWETLKQGVTEIAPGYPVDYMVMGSLGNRILVYYWQLWHGMWVTEEKITKPYLIWDSLYQRRTDGALVRLITPVGNNLQETQEVLKGFARLLLPVLPQFISYDKPQNR